MQADAELKEEARLAFIAEQQRLDQLKLDEKNRKERERQELLEFQKALEVEQFSSSTIYDQERILRASYERRKKAEEDARLGIQEPPVLPVTILDKM